MWQQYPEPEKSILGSTMKAYCAILAGGTGVRMGGDTPKQFLMLNDAPIIVHTVRRILSFNLFERLVVVVHPQWKDFFLSLAHKYDIAFNRIVVTHGGADRIDSIKNALSALRSMRNADDKDIVVVHDAVRPFVSREIMASSVNCAAEHGACVATVPAADTILEVEDGVVVSVPTRSRLFLGQAPDSAQISILEKALESLTEDERRAITGTAQILTLKGIRVHTISGDVRNIKITTASDMELAKRFMI